jgi:2-C-methyl-D-erythritol 4-phosphate cytidylyltransferase/2-C-methyl-D-erythritol 2,4-cyclodiphosphate synthase
LAISQEALKHPRAFLRRLMAGEIAAIVVAGGRGERAEGDLPKQYRRVLGEPVIRRSLCTFITHPEVALIQSVIHADDANLYREAVQGLDLLEPAFGGRSRQTSVRAGLEALKGHNPKLVLIHDAARPFVSGALITRAIVAGHASGAAIPATVIADTIKKVDPTGRVTETVDRSHLRAVQTPQAFHFGIILDAHRRAQSASREDFTDDAALAEWAGVKVTTFAGEADNMKLTSNEDFQRAETQSLGTLLDVRTGLGFDVHQFAPGDHVMLGGIRIPHQCGLSGHSDADVVLHAIVDALLGAIAEGDIGTHFPPTDPQWRGASSDRFLAFAVDRVRARGGKIVHIDVTVVCEAPRIASHRDAMRARIAAVAGIAAGRVGVKATTSEKMGFIGRSEGMAAFANATVRLPWFSD